MVAGVGLPIALNATGGAAEWIMVLPAGAGGVIATVDTKGPFRVTDFQKLATDSLNAAGGRIPIDENHATDLAAPLGGPSPARGWATEFDVRADGIYARVEWSASGAQLMSEKAYRFISPVLRIDKQKNVERILRASLTNTPNLPGMAALNSQENDMDLLAKLRDMLGLATDADEAAIWAKFETWMKGAKTEVANAILAPIAKAVGLKDSADATTVLNAVTTLATAKPADATALQATIGGLQAELTTVTNNFNTLQTTIKTEKATAFVDAAIKRGVVGVKPLRDHYITMHAADPARVEKEIGAMSVLGASGALETPPANKGGTIALNSEQKNAAKILGIPEADYLKTLQSEAAA